MKNIKFFLYLLFMLTAVTIFPSCEKEPPNPPEQNEPEPPDTFSVAVTNNIGRWKPFDDDSLFRYWFVEILNPEFSSTDSVIKLDIYYKSIYDSVSQSYTDEIDTIGSQTKGLTLKYDEFYSQRHIYPYKHEFELIDNDFIAVFGINALHTYEVTVNDSSLNIQDMPGLWLMVYDHRMGLTQQYYVPYVKL